MTDADVAADRAASRLEIAQAVERDLLRHVDRPGPKERAMIEVTAKLAAGTAVATASIRGCGYCTSVEFEQLRTAGFSLIEGQHVLEATDAPLLGSIINDVIALCAAFEAQPDGHA